MTATMRITRDGRRIPGPVLKRLGNDLIETHVLEKGDSQALFLIGDNEVEIQVLSSCGYYEELLMSREQARDQWRKLVAAGWTKAD